MSFTPLLPSRMARQNAVFPMPLGLTTPMPVITARLSIDTDSIIDAGFMRGGRPSQHCGDILTMSRTRDVIVWWEVRRIPYNLALLATGLISVFAMVGIGGRLVPVGEDFVEPFVLFFGVIVYAFLANVCYSLGWITELIWKSEDT